MRLTRSALLGVQPLSVTNLSRLTPKLSSVTVAEKKNARGLPTSEKYGENAAE